MSDNKSNYAEIIAMWGIQETLLQQYRTIFITMQSIFIAVASSVFQRNDPWLPMGVLFALAMFTLWLWISICERRGRSVYVCQYFALKVEDGQEVAQPLKSLKDLEEGESLDPVMAKDPLFLYLHLNKTRRKMQVLLPWVFVAAWALLWVDIFRNHWFVALPPK